jgi:hypothetical protein
MTGKTKKELKTFFFVDESGDPYFYDRQGNFIPGKEGCSKILMLGFVKTEQPEVIRRATNQIREEIKKDEYLREIPSVKKSLIAFHATDDCPEVREKIYKAVTKLPFKSEFIVARKKENIFIKRHQKKPNLFYDDLISKLLQNHLHKSKSNVIYFAVRSNRARQRPLEDAIRKAILTFENKHNIKIDSEIKLFAQKPEGEPCLQVVDYMNWAVYRAFTKKEMRYYNFVKEKISLIFDIYDFDKYPKNYYTKRNQFDVNKISPL